MSNEICYLSEHTTQHYTANTYDLLATGLAAADEEFDVDNDPSIIKIRNHPKHGRSSGTFCT
jgi:hypothetical protein